MRNDALGPVQANPFGCAFSREKSLIREVGKRTSTYKIAAVLPFPSVTSGGSAPM